MGEYDKNLYWEKIDLHPSNAGFLLDALLVTKFNFYSLPNILIEY